MEAILVTPKNINEYSILTEFLKRNKIDSNILSLDEKEDFGLLQLMNEADRSKKVTRESIMKIFE